MSSSANVLVSASFPTAVSADWQIRVVLISSGALAAVDLLPKVCPMPVAGYWCAGGHRQHLKHGVVGNILVLIYVVPPRLNPRQLRRSSI
jgi:hypothetical protein